MRIPSIKPFLCLAVAAALGASQLQAATLSLGPVWAGSSLTATFSNHTGGTTKDWIGIYKGGQTPGSSTPSTWWAYPSPNGTNATGSATTPATLFNNSQIGTSWFARFFSNDGYGAVTGDTTVSFVIGSSPNITIAADKSIYDSSETISIAWSNNAGVVPKDWIGIYPTGTTPDGDPVSTAWSYATTSSGNKTFTGLAPGSYDVFLLANDGYYQLAKGQSFQVVPETSSLVLGSLSLGAIILRRRRAGV
ncbi:MAG: hypothetical protein J0M04_08435 [Verrucomicrobia bacterium]|nr:hypothetical protein [Verrucomicrobiota bacterium]